MIRVPGQGYRHAFGLGIDWPDVRGGGVHRTNPPGAALWTGERARQA